MSSLPIGRIEVKSFIQFIQLLEDYKISEPYSIACKLSYWVFLSFIATGIAGLILIRKNNILSPLIMLFSSFIGCNNQTKLLVYLSREFAHDKSVTFTPQIGLVISSICVYALAVIAFVLLICCIVILAKILTGNDSDDNSIKCPHCGAVNSVTQTYCSKCGKDMYQNLEQTTNDKWKCNKCNTLNPNNSKFCQNCGNSKY